MLNSSPGFGQQPPAHVAIIMDGNGRWANARGLPRTIGHQNGLEAVRRVVRAAPECGIRFLTLYAFSSENWSRPPDEVNDLMGLLRLFIRRDLAELAANNVRVRILGRRDNLQADILQLVEMAEEKTSQNSGLFLNIAFNYGGRDEIVRAVQKLVDERVAAAQSTGGSKELNIRLQDVEDALDTNGQPDPDLIIRTSGEMRLSNFLPWQSAYSEFVFAECLWPDFTAAHLRDAIAEYHSRDRRYGGVSKQPTDIAL